MSVPADQGELLVVDDEPFLRDAVAASLRFPGFEMSTAGNGTDALRLARDRRLDLAGLDVMLPGTGRFEVARRLRQDGCQVPVIFLTAPDTQAGQVAGLTIGDDYITKPFGHEELAARVRAVPRRTGGAPIEQVLTFAGLELDQDSHQVRRGRQLIELSPTELRLLRYLMHDPGRVLTRAQARPRAGLRLRRFRRYRVAPDTACGCPRPPGRRSRKVGRRARLRRASG